MLFMDSSLAAEYAGDIGSLHQVQRLSCTVLGTPSSNAYVRDRSSSVLEIS